ncbi:hypothetical protein EV426DRAFT_583402 [Tirmania nivea]|nr:hypothetical protein EV426DRAFT_583402 [Tirmania nivea]
MGSWRANTVTLSRFLYLLRFNLSALSSQECPIIPKTLKNTIKSVRKHQVDTQPTSVAPLQLSALFNLKSTEVLLLLHLI